jgi:predicted DNA-binding transcriptional regulator AlpA
MTANQQTLIEPLLLDSFGASKLLGISRSHLMALRSSGRVPSPVKLGNRTLWSVSELRNWIAAGTPRREVWEQRKKEGAL